MLDTQAHHKQIKQIITEDQWSTELAKLTSGNVKERQDAIRYKTAKAKSVW
jgi:hypothetical protein